MLKDEDKARVPKEGMWRLITPMQIAQTVWDAYHGDKIHYYVPAELKDSTAQRPQRRKKRGLHNWRSEKACERIDARPKA